VRERSPEWEYGAGLTKVLITGGRGFLGRNLASFLRERPDSTLAIFDAQDSSSALRDHLSRADVVFHLAGVNRPKELAEFETSNVGLTQEICLFLRQLRRAPKIVFSSSIQAELDNPYGVSKRKAEEVLREFGVESGACVRIYRLKNLFGKWCRPNYNAVTATFCHNIANNLPISISDPNHELELSYVDDVVAAFADELSDQSHDGDPAARIPSYCIRLGELARRIQAFHDMRKTLAAPDFSDCFNRALYATYLSCVPSLERKHDLEVKSDQRGSLAEFIKQRHFGQIFVSRTKPGVTRGNHYHHTKIEKFFVLEGEAVIRMRHIEGQPVEEYPVKGTDYRVIDIPPGYTHSITNVGTGELVTLFWSDELFDANRPDTYHLSVEADEEAANG
jgi:UDP-2-acetamido-2,6-beta-L-arabino-hexul-4-ose reductase